MRLIQSKFVAWLRSKAPTEIVGENRDCHSCPIAKFYNEASGGCDLVIFERWGEYFGDRGGGARPLPVWAQHFVFAVDGDENGQITADRALEIVVRG